MRPEAYTLGYGGLGIEVFTKPLRELGMELVIELGGDGPAVECLSSSVPA